MDDLELLLSLQSEDLRDDFSDLRGGEAALDSNAGDPGCSIGSSNPAAGNGASDHRSKAVSQVESPGYCSDEEPIKSKPLPNMSAFKGVLKRHSTLPDNNLPGSQIQQVKKMLQKPSVVASGGGDLELHSGLRIKNRAICSASLTSKLAELRFIRLQALKNALVGDAIKGSWATIGVVTEKAPPKIASNGKNFVIWKLNCLDSTTVSLFLFGDAYREHWKEFVGSIVAVFDASVRKDEKRNDFSLSIFNVNQLMVVGTSADFAFCQGKRKDGAPCSLPVNTRASLFCKYHASAARTNVRSKRPELSGGNLAAGRFGPRNQANPIKRAVEESLGAAAPLKRSRHQSSLELSKLLSNADRMTTRTSSQGLKFLASMAENKDVVKKKTQKRRGPEANQTRVPLKELVTPVTNLHEVEDPASRRVETLELDFEMEDGSDDAMAQAVLIFSKAPPATS